MQILRLDDGPGCRVTAGTSRPDPGHGSEGSGRIGALAEASPCCDRNFNPTMICPETNPGQSRTCYGITNCVSGDFQAPRARSFLVNHKPEKDAERANSMSWTMYSLDGQRKYLTQSETRKFLEAAG